MDKLEKNLNEILDVESKELISTNEKEASIVEENSEENVDFKEARYNMKEAIRKGDEALDGVLSLAQSADSARPYEVAAMLVKTIVDANKDMMGLHKQKKDLKETSRKRIDNTGSQNIDKAIIFNGSTTELQKLLKEKKDENC